MAKKAIKVSGEMNIDIRLPPPNPKQKEFMLSKCKYTAYGGARAGGKSWAVRAKGHLGALSYPGIRILIMRRTYNELEQTIIQPLNKLIGEAMLGDRPAGDYIASYNATMRTVFYRNGSVIRFGHLNNSADLSEYQGQEYDWVFMDEATHFSEYEFRVLGATLRGVNDIPKRMYLTCNPGGVGHQWVKRLFVSREYKDGERGQDYKFVPATVDDNTALSDDQRLDYIASLDLLPEDIRAAHRYGDWDAMAGQYFSEFKREVHVVKPFIIPQEWVRYRCFDYGLDMFACYWAAVDFTGRIYIYREYCEKGLIVSKAAEAMRMLTGDDERILCTIAPPDMWTTQKDTGRTMADIYTENGIGLVKASNTRIQGWLNLKEYLKIREDGNPGLLVFEDCRSIISDLPAMQHDPKNPSDCAKEPHDITHSPDAVRYLCMYRKMNPQHEVVMDSFDDGGLEDYDDFMTGGMATASYIGYS